MSEPSCKQFEVFQSGVNPDKLVLLERWTDQAALDAHSKLNSTRPSFPSELRTGTTEREDYEYNRTRSGAAGLNDLSSRSGQRDIDCRPDS